VVDPEGGGDIDGGGLDGGGLDGGGLDGGGLDGGGLDGGGLDDAGHVWVRLKKLAVPVITAVAPTKVRPAGVTIHAFDVCGPPLSKLPGLAALVMVTVPLAPKSAVTDTKSPLTLCIPGSTKTQTS